MRSWIKERKNLSTVRVRTSGTPAIRRIVRFFWQEVRSLNPGVRSQNRRTSGGNADMSFLFGDRATGMPKVWSWRLDSCFRRNDDEKSVRHSACRTMNGVHRRLFRITIGDDCFLEAYRFRLYPGIILPVFSCIAGKMETTVGRILTEGSKGRFSRGSATGICWKNGARPDAPVRHRG